MKFLSSLIITSIVIFSLFLLLIFISSKIFVYNDLNEFWENYRIFFIIQIFILFAAGAGVSSILIWNSRKIFYIENEDWPGLAALMEDVFLKKGRFSTKNLKLFLNSHFLSGDFETIKTSIPVIRNKNPKFFNKHRASLGAVFLMTREYEQAVDFFRESCNFVKNDSLLCFFYAYSLYCANKKDDASEIFIRLLKNENTLLKLLSAYGIMRIMDLSFIFLGDEKRELEQELESLKKEFKAELPLGKASYNKIFNNFQKEIYGPIIKNWYEKSLIWLNS